VRLEHDADLNGSFEQVVRKYVFSYNASDEGIIFPGYDWPEKDENPETITIGKTLTLKQVQEFGLNGASLPATSFTYGDGMHLTEANNGYGGEVEFVYTGVWNELDAVEGRKIEQDFGEWLEPCEYDGDDTGGWTARNPASDVVWCQGGQLHVDGEAYLWVPAYLLQPGGRYRAWTNLGGDGNDTHAQVGLWDGTSNEYQPEPARLILEGPPETLDYKFSLDSGSGGAQALLKCVAEDCYVNDYTLTLLPVRYRVSQKTVYDGLGGSQTFTYNYDEPATNDAVHSAGASTDRPYVKMYAEFRGHALMQEAGPDGRATTTWYHQDDARRGQPHTVLVSQQDFWEAFANLNPGSWSYSSQGTRQTVERLDGDYALKNNNPEQDWDEYAKRNSDSLGDGDMLLAHFRLSESGARSVLAVEDYQNPSYRWGVFVHDDLIEWQRNSGSGFVQGTLLSGFQREKWYTLLLGVDNQGFSLQVWERDNPGVVGRYTYGMPINKTWHFANYPSGGTTWLDACAEGQAYSLTTTLYASDPQSHGTLPMAEYGDPLPATDLAITWTRPVRENLQTFKGGCQLGRAGQPVRVQR